jgi:hypothetical protein
MHEMEGPRPASHRFASDRSVARACVACQPASGDPPVLPVARLLLLLDGGSRERWCRQSPGCSCLSAGLPASAGAPGCPAAPASRESSSAALPRVAPRLQRPRSLPRDPPKFPSGSVSVPGDVRRFLVVRGRPHKGLVAVVSDFFASSPTSPQGTAGCPPDDAVRPPVRPPLHPQAPEPLSAMWTAAYNVARWAGAQA